MASFVHERRLIGEVHRNGRRQMDIALARAVHSANLLDRIAVLRIGDAEQQFGIFVGELNPHAAMAECALVLVKQVLVRRIVLINQEFIWEIEANATQRIGLAWRLIDMHGAVPIVLHLEAHTTEYRRVLRQGRQVFIVDNRRRHVPGWVEGDEFHRLAEQRRGLFARLARDDLGRPHH